MKYLFTALLLAVAAMADQEASNVPLVRASEYGRCYARSIPDDLWGTAGTTRIFQVGRDGDVPLAEYPWYASEMYLGGPGDQCLVRFGPWSPGGEPREDHLAIGFYRDGRTLREYSTLEIYSLGSGISRSVSHYEVFGARLGFQSSSGDTFLYRVEGIDGRVFTFDLNSGEILE